MGVMNRKLIIILILSCLIILNALNEVVSIRENKANNDPSISTPVTPENCSTSSRNQNSPRGNWEIISGGVENYSPKICVNDNIIHVIWNCYNIWMESAAIVYRRSINAGLTWENSTNLDSITSRYLFKSPSIAVNGSDVYAVWGDHRGVFSNSSNNGQNWSEKKVIIANYISSTEVEITNESLFLVWCPYNVYDLFFKKSIDGGKNWGNNIRLTFNGSVQVYDLNGFVAYNDNLHIVWVDQRDGNYEIYYKRSTNGGNIWSNDTRLTNNASQSMYPSIAVDGNNVHVVWMDDRDGNFEIYYKKSIDNGKTWSKDVRLTSNASNSKTPTIAVDGNNIHVVWCDNRPGYYHEIFYKYSNDCGNNWSSDFNLNLTYTEWGSRADTNQPSIAIKDNYTYIVWSAIIGVFEEVVGFKYFPFLPRVIVFPDNNSINVPISNNITMMFNQPMNHNSVENAFSISPNVQGSFQWNDNSCIFIPSSNLSYNTTYMAKIDGTASNLTSVTLDGNGNGISEGSPIDDFQWSFTTEKYINPDRTPPSIVSINPSNGAQNVSLKTSIQVAFSEPMNITATQKAFSIIPSYTEGNFNWSDNNYNLTFTPTFNFNRNTTYKIIISTDAKDISNNSLDGNKNGVSEISSIDDYIWEFSTERYIPVSRLLYPADRTIISTTYPIFEWDLENTYIWPENHPMVFFDIYLDTNQSNVINLDKIARIANNITASSYQVFTTVQGSYYWTVIPYTNDAVGMCKSSIWQFQIDLPPIDLIPPQIISTIPKNNSIDINIDTNIQVIFTEPMNRSSVEQAFSTNPYIEGEFRWSGNDTILTFYPQNYLNLSKNYTVKVTTFARDTSGNPLDGNRNSYMDDPSLDDYIWTFTTAAFINIKPSIIIDSPMSHSVFNFNDTIYFDCFNTTDLDGDLLEFLWVSNISGILSTQPQFSTSLPLGHHQITLYVDDGQGHNISESINIIITPWNRPPVAIISSPSEGAVFNITDFIQFDASSSYDLDLDALEFYWHSNISGGFGYSSRFTTPLPEGQHLISLHVNDGFYHNVSISINITVIDPSASPPGPGNNGGTKPPPTDKDKSFFSQASLYIGIVLIIIIVIIFGFAAATEVGTYGVLGSFVPLYRRLKGKKVLDNETRGMVRGYILANPGEHYSIIKRTLKLPNGTLTYHLKVLEDEGLVKSERDGIYKRFYPIEMQLPKNATHLSKIQETILNEIIIKPGITESGLGNKIEVSPRVINYHMKALVGAGLIKAERFGKKNKYYVVDDTG